VLSETGDGLYVWEGSDGTNTRVQARVRRADGTLGPVQTLSPAGQDAVNASVSIDANGDALVVWERSDGTKSRIEARHRSADGTLGPVQKISAAGQDAFDPHVRVDPGGLAEVIWRRTDGTNFRIETLERGQTGTLSPVQTLSPADQDAADPRIAVDATGNVTAVWTGDADCGGVPCNEAQVYVSSGAIGLASPQ
jgi:hypothetical protein